MEFRELTIDVPQAVLDDLTERLARTRWPNEPTGGEAGGLGEVRRLVSHWAEHYDWSEVQDRLNRWTHRVARVDGRDVHVVHERSAAPGAVPLLLLHGWPDSFYRFAHVVDRLTRRDGDDDDGPAFDVVVPSLPGYVFSEQPEPGGATLAAVAETIAQVMAGLGYERYVVHGGDWGAAIAQEIARAHPERVLGLHLTDVPFPNMFTVDRESATDAERAYLGASMAWAESASYFTVQSGAPLELAYGLSDSPVGLAGWLGDKFRAWSQAPLADDDVLTNVMLYWVTNTVRSSFRFYAEGLGGEWDSGDAAEWGGSAESGGVAESGGAAESGGSGGWGGDAAGYGSVGSGEWGGDAAGSGSGDDAGAAAADWSPRIEVPTAIALFPADLGGPAPREYVERFFDVRRYTLMPRGGHFAALEEPALLVDDLRAFAAQLAEAR
ncbi:Epoxide hydrolase domain protein [Beutenbergia cavernae DSM 12333]|uniref:Epoxide hydrolase domain protein n=1 Tax=Beutenbergia cavernae (strain ATCC BAA-8 / DSM 12333 / CCUG 43141 / JCM 11478 / NBRC 16432 / NCIMB 13614 / HKI 0122) TaxID=471853 RepID=C5C6M0_BEUC1|nr:epoxide hydrolase [Beutenbergia cavernae]ACQ82444.1 Epoxide hydrolase domain protein [Beutenbergia cavernae DSM 12333]